jgi:hypothetical protein
LYLDNGGSFNDGNQAIVIESYDFKTNDAKYGFQQPAIYKCIVRDGEVFIRSDSTFLPDVPSDQPTFNPSDSYIYYNDLVDGAPQPDGPYGVATFMDPAHFYPDSINNTYITEIYDCNVFYDYNINAGPCDNLTFLYAYNEPTNYANVRLPNSDTVLDNSLSGINATKNSLYYTRNIEYGDFYIRNANNTFIGPVSSSLSAVIINFDQDIQNEIYNNIINFDIYYDTLQIETENYLIFNKIVYDYNTNQITGTTNLYSVIRRGDWPELEKFSTVWFDEKANTLMVAAMTLYNKLSATNYKAIYPTIFNIDLVTGKTVQVYPNKNTSALTFSELSAFSLFGKSIELDIVRVEKPTLNYSNDTDYYTITYLGKDTANCFYIVTIRFQYIQNTVKNINCTLHKPATDVYNITFANQLPNGAPAHSPYFDTHTVTGSATGYIDQGNFVWGYNVNA